MAGSNSSLPDSDSAMVRKSMMAEGDLAKQSILESSRINLGLVIGGLPKSSRTTNKAKLYFANTQRANSLLRRRKEQAHCSRDGARACMVDTISYRRCCYWLARQSNRFREGQGRGADSVAAGPASRVSKGRGHWARDIPKSTIGKIFISL